MRRSIYIAPVIAIMLALGVAAAGIGIFGDRAQAGVDPAPAGQGATAALWSGSIVLRNDGTEPATVVINFYSTTGDLVKSHALDAPLPSKGSVTVDTESIDDLPNGFVGSAVVSASQPVSATFVGFDVTDNQINPTLSNGFSTGAATMYVPAISHNYADQTSTLAVQNVDSVPAVVTIRYFERFTGMQTTMVTDTIAPNASHFYDSSNLPGDVQLPPPWTGAALVHATGGRVAATVHQPYLSSNKAVAFEGTAVVRSAIYLPSALYQYSTQLQTTHIAVQNTQEDPITLTITFYTTTGQSAGSVTGTIEGLQKQSWNPGSAGIAPGFSGTAVVRATGPVAAVVNIGALNDLSLAYTGQTLGTLRQSLPYIHWSPSSNPKGLRTYIAAMNTDQIAPSDIIIRYYGLDGTLLQAPAFANVPPNAKVNHNPGMFIGDADFVGSVEIESTRTVIGIVNAITGDDTQAESYTSVAIP